MAYAALLSLSQTLDQILVHDQYLYSLEKEKLTSLQGNVLTFLQDYSHSNEINLFESQIIDASYRVEDIIESKLSSIYKNKAQTIHSCKLSFVCLPQIETGWMDLHNATRDIEVLLEKVMITSGTSTAEESNKNTNSVQPPEVKIENDGPEGSDCTNTQVGFVNEYEAIKNRMYHRSSDFKIIPIVGMGGIGKTTLARRIYEDSIRARCFDRCAWVVVSQGYSSKEILLAVLRSIMENNNDFSGNSVAELIVLIHKELFCRRYLIILDDVWSENGLDDLNTAMPKNDNGSCVLLTTRLSKVATCVTSTPVHEMHLLSEDESWILLKKSVFGTTSIPSELEIIGKKIAEECHGLPLTIVVVAGLLKGKMTKEYWESISQNISSRERTIELRCSKVLSLSYNHLPIHLKPCFLYVTAFPEDSKINAKRLMRLWMAEGFIISRGSKSSEEVAEEYLDDLAGRSILQVSKRKYNDRIKTVGIHDLLRDVGILKAQEERFLYNGHLGTILSKQHHRRLSIHTKKILHRLGDIRNSTTRSVLIFSTDNDDSPALISNFTMLRILDAPTTIPAIDPDRLVHSKYLAFKNRRKDLFKSWFMLPNLQTLIIHEDSLTLLIVPLEIWTMPSLRHLILPEESYLEQPNLDHEVVKETNLVTLSKPLSLEMNGQLTKMLANLKKLGLRYDGVDRVEQQDKINSQFGNIVHLEKLEELKIFFIIGLPYPDISVIAQVELAFPLTLKKLTLHSIQRRWRDMSIVGSLPNLEVLKLRGRVCTDLEWKPADGQFLKLKYLEFRHVPLRHWEAESCHFPSLEILYMHSMDWRVELKEIPSDFEELDTLILIHLVSCYPPLENSALQIQANRREMGDTDLQVIFSNPQDI